MPHSSNTKPTALITGGSPESEVIRDADMRRRERDNIARTLEHYGAQDFRAVGESL